MSRFLLTATLSFLLLRLSLQAQELEDPLPLPQRCETGMLPNGLRYIIQPNNHPAKKIELRLVLAVGAQWEEKNERGMSHFLEHMAFAGSDMFPGRSLVAGMESMGIRYGYDLNAFTGYDRTVYEIPTPTDREENIGIALNILRSLLSGLHLHPADIAKEQKIVIREIKDAPSPSPFDSLKKSDSRFALSSVLGDEQDVMSMDSASLRGYYNQWYRPDKATLIAVGDLDVPNMIRAIKQRFGSIEARTEKARLNTKHTLPKNGGFVYGQRADSLISSDHLDLIFPVKSNEGKTFGDLREKLKDDLFSLMLNRRLLSDSLLSCQYSRCRYLADIDHAGFDLSAGSLHALLPQVERIAALLQQIHRFGFDPQELDDARQAMREKLNGSTPGIISSQSLCNQYVDLALTGEVPLEESVRNHHYSIALPEIRLEELQERATLLVKPEQRIMACLQYRPAHSRGCNANEPKRAWEAGLNAPAKPYRYKPSRKTGKEESRIIDLKTEPLPPSRIISQKEYPSINLTEYILSNGLRLAVRPVNGGDKTILLSLFGKGGFSTLPPGAYPFFRATASYADDAGINGYSPEQISDFLYEKKLSLLTNIDNYYHELYGAAFNGDIESLMKLLYLKATNTSFSEDFLPETLTQKEKGTPEESILEKQLKVSPERVLDDYLADYSGVAHCERKELDKEQSSLFSVDSVALFYRQLFASPNRLTAIVTGAFDSEKTVPLLVRYLGSLPLSPSKTNPPRDIGSHFPQGIARQNIKDPNANRSSVTIAFHGSHDHSLKQSLIFKMMRDIIQRRMLNVLRQQEGKTYSPYASVTYSVDPSPRHAFLLSYECDDTDAEHLEQRLLFELNRLKQHPITQRELNNMKRSFLICKRESLNESNISEWRNKLREIYLECDGIDDFAAYEPILNNITTDDILCGFRSFLSLKQYTVFTIKK